MADAYQYIESTGVIVPDTADLLTEVQGEYQSVFGADLVLTPDTPQGVLMTAEALARANVVANNAALANQINPNISGGQFLDAICALTGLQRTVATQSYVIATLTGDPSSNIPAGVRAKTGSGDIFALAGAVVIGAGGSAQGTFIAEEFGPIAAPSGQLTQIVDGVLGWETVTNAAAAALGTTTQTDQALRILRRNTLAQYGVGLVEAQISALYATTGVRSLKFQENTAATTQTINGISMVAHSVYACVDGGTDADVAMTLLANKSTGAAWNGGTTVNVTEPISGQVYAVKFDRPTAVPVAVRATVKVGNSLVDPVAATTQAILDYAAGLVDGEAGLVVGANVSPYELAGAVNVEQPSIYVKNMELSTDGGTTWSNAEATIAVNQIANIASSAINVVVVT